MKKENIEPIPLSLYILPITQNGKPAILLRKTISDPEIVQKLCTVAAERSEYPATLYFRDPYISIVKLKKMGLLKKEL